MNDLYPPTLNGRAYPLWGHQSKRPARLFAFVLFCISLQAQILPPPDVPGAVNPDVTQQNIQTTICKHGYTKTIRPPVSYTDALKRSELVKYHLAGKLDDYELDHLISLELGGNPTDEHNLWMQPYKPAPGARQKDTLETRLHKLVCAGTLSLQEAQEAIATNWWSAYQRCVKAK